MTPQEFEIVAPGKAARLFPLFIGLFLPMVMLAIMALAAKGTSDWLRAAPAVLVLPLAGGLVAWSMHRRMIRVSDQGLSLRWLPWSRPVKLAELELEQARILNLEEHPELLPKMKIAGSRFPGFRMGLFRLRDRRKAMVLLTDLRRVLVLPKRDGSVILLSPQRPDALLAALQARG